MINEQYLAMLSNKSVIRELSEYATRRGKEVGYENVFDFSLGNPSVPVPDSFNESIEKLLKEEEPVKLHGYSPSLGIPEVKEKVAASLTERFGIPYTGNLIFPTSGAAGAIAHALRAVTKPGDEVLVFAPYFPEYVPYINTTGARIKVVPADMENFQINFDAAEEAMTENVAAVLINTPNNPSGVLYSVETLEKLALLLKKKSAEYGHNIFLISDEPYREIIFDGCKAPYPAAFYDHTLVCYSFSKSLSIPGERIGYVAVNPTCEQAENLVPMMGQISRGIGHNCPSSVIMLAMAENVDKTADLSVYETNMNLFYNLFVELGFKVVRPGGTFYIMPKALEEDDVMFCKKALQYDLVFVPAGGFGAPGHFRIAYCTDTEKVERALPRIRQFVEECYPNR
ncbi:MAG: pyridoxal phosphate-dependent aminotransferase [Lachnospiraceae bacterium]|nr:pyridoxal phosphate-dependent aminotransferase [Lachnospiraceae bacterium]